MIITGLLARTIPIPVTPGVTVTAKRNSITQSQTLSRGRCVLEITCLLTVALLQCNCLSDGCLLWRRLTRPESLAPAQFLLDRLSIPIDAAAVFQALWAVFWSFWPKATPVTAAGFDWSSVIFVGVLLTASVHFDFEARHVYTGPVALVDGRRSR